MDDGKVHADLGMDFFCGNGGPDVLGLLNKIDTRKGI
jgi:hypothetical protein